MSKIYLYNKGGVALSPNMKQSISPKRNVELKSTKALNNKTEPVAPPFFVEKVDIENIQFKTNLSELKVRLEHYGACKTTTLNPSADLSDLNVKADRTSRTTDLEIIQALIYFYNKKYPQNELGLNADIKTAKAILNGKIAFKINRKDISAIIANKSPKELFKKAVEDMNPLNRLKNITGNLKSIVSSFKNEEISPEEASDKVKSMQKELEQIAKLFFSEKHDAELDRQFIVEINKIIDILSSISFVKNSKVSVTNSSTDTKQFLGRLNDVLDTLITFAKVGKQKIYESIVAKLTQAKESLFAFINELPQDSQLPVEAIIDDIKEDAVKEKPAQAQAEINERKESAIIEHLNEENVVILEKAFKAVLDGDNALDVLWDLSTGNFSVADESSNISPIQQQSDKSLENNPEALKDIASKENEDVIKNLTLQKTNLENSIQENKRLYSELQRRELHILSNIRKYEQSSNELQETLARININHSRLLDTIQAQSENYKAGSRLMMDYKSNLYNSNTQRFSLYFEFETAEALRNAYLKEQVAIEQKKTELHAVISEQQAELSKLETTINNF